MPDKHLASQAKYGAFFLTVNIIAALQGCQNEFTNIMVQIKTVNTY